VENGFPFKGYVDSAIDVSQVREKRLLSPFWWGLVPINPVNTAPVLNAVRDISRGVVLKLVENYAHLITLPDKIYENPNDYNFAHYYRFTIRSFFTISMNFNAFTPIEPCELEGFSLMLVFHEKLGEVNDLIEAYKFYQKDDNKQGMEETAAKIVVLWPKARQYFQEVSWLYKLTCVLTSLKRG